MSHHENPEGQFPARSYDPRSVDSMFSTLLQRMEGQDKTLERIEAGVTKTNGRVTALERWRDVVTAKTAVIAGVISILGTITVKLLLG